MTFVSFVKILMEELKRRSRLTPDPQTTFVNGNCNVSSKVDFQTAVSFHISKLRQWIAMVPKAVPVPPNRPDKYLLVIKSK